MPEINWNLLSNAPDPGQSFMAGFERGQALRKQQQEDSALQALGADPTNQGALAALFGVNPALATQVQQYGRSEAEYKRKEQVRTGLAGALKPDGTLDQDKAMAAYVGAGDVEGAQQFRQRETQQQLQQLDLHDKIIEHGLQLLGGVHDQPSWDAAKTQYQQTLQQYGIAAPDLPAEYSPDTVHALQMQSLSVKEQIEASKPILMSKDSRLVSPTGATIADNSQPEYKTFSVKNGDGSETVYGFDPETGRTFDLDPNGNPVGDAHGGTSALAGNNPGGIVDGAYAKKMPGYAGANGRFARFNTIQDGINAQTQLLKSYIARGYDTPAKIAARWAPAGDGSNNPVQYAANVAKALGIGVNDKISPDQISAFQHAQAMQENSMYGSALANGSTTPKGSGHSLTGKPASIDIDPESVKFIGSQVALGAPIPPLGMGKEAAAMRRSILAEATKQWRAMGISPGEANVIAAQNKSGLAELAKIAQIRANVLTAENTANANATQVLDLLGSAGTTGSPIFNGWQQAGRRATGDPKISALDVAVKTLATEYARVMSGSGSTVLSDSARHEVDALLHTSMTPDQFRSTIRQMKIDMENRRKGIEQERQQTLNQIRTGGRTSGPVQVTPTIRRIN